MKDNIFLVFKDEDGILRPMTFIVRDNEVGRLEAERKQFTEGKIVKVKMEEIYD